MPPLLDLSSKPAINAAALIVRRRFYAGGSDEIPADARTFIRLAEQGKVSPVDAEKARASLVNIEQGMGSGRNRSIVQLAQTVLSALIELSSRPAMSFAARALGRLPVRRPNIPAVDGEIHLVSPPEIAVAVAAVAQEMEGEEPFFSVGTADEFRRLGLKKELTLDEARSARTALAVLLMDAREDAILYGKLIEADHALEMLLTDLSHPVRGYPAAARLQTGLRVQEGPRFSAELVAAAPSSRRKPFSLHTALTSARVSLFWAPTSALLLAVAKSDIPVEDQRAFRALLKSQVRPSMMVTFPMVMDDGSTRDIVACKGGSDPSGSVRWIITGDQKDERWGFVHDVLNRGDRSKPTTDLRHEEVIAVGAFGIASAVLSSQHSHWREARVSVIGSENFFKPLEQLLRTAGAMAQKVMPFAPREEDETVTFSRPRSLTHGKSKDRDYMRVKLTSGVETPAEFIPDVYFVSGGQIITRNVARNIKEGSIVVELSYDVITPAAEAVLAERKVMIVPFDLVKGGAEALTQLKWVQSLDDRGWHRSRLEEAIRGAVVSSYASAQQIADTINVPLRKAAHILAAERLYQATFLANPRPILAGTAELQLADDEVTTPAGDRLWDHRVRMLPRAPGVARFARTAVAARRLATAELGRAGWCRR